MRNVTERNQILPGGPMAQNELEEAGDGTYPNLIKKGKLPKLLAELVGT